MHIADEAGHLSLLALKAPLPPADVFQLLPYSSQSLVAAHCADLESVSSLYWNRLLLSVTSLCHVEFFYWDIWVLRRTLSYLLTWSWLFGLVPNLCVCVCVCVCVCGKGQIQTSCIEWVNSKDAKTSFWRRSCEGALCSVLHSELRRNIRNKTYTNQLAISVWDHWSHYSPMGVITISTIWHQMPLMFPWNI